ncbi:hypothetical protein BIW11_02423 [Tropilaelaps mercedesae]|uniref:Uncharacterized protein n=1 Tax=Tropilaelaps mercedesae TaxID=418985 RepID=A0A1V9Y3D1_9ACAR|nr:hypothetical protein BIW11_02423 [Tropilaelaps mercedesae]
MWIVGKCSILRDSVSSVLHQRQVSLKRRVSLPKENAAPHPYSSRQRRAETRRQTCQTSMGWILSAVLRVAKVSKMLMTSGTIKPRTAQGWEQVTNIAAVQRQAHKWTYSKASQKDTSTKGKHAPANLSWDQLILIVSQCH